MPPPIAFKTVLGRYTTPSGTPAAGDLRFVPLATVLDAADGEVVVPQPVTVTLDVAGEFAVELMCTDAPLTAPTGWVWALDELFAGGRKRFLFQLPTAGGATVNIADVLPASEIDASYAFYSQSSGAALEARVNGVEAVAGTIAAAYLIHPFVMLG